MRLWTNFAIGSLLFLTACWDDVADSGHGTDTPNAITVLLVDQQGKPIANAEVNARIRNADSSAYLLTGKTNAQGSWQFPIPTGARAWVSASTASGDTLRYAAQSLGDTTLTALLRLDHSIQLGSASTSDSPVKILEIPYDSTTDISLAKSWDSTKIKSSISIALDYGFSGLSFTIFGKYSATGDTPSIDTSARERLRWVYRQIKKQGLIAQTVIWDPSASERSDLLKWNSEFIWLRSNLYFAQAIPVLNASELSASPKTDPVIEVYNFGLGALSLENKNEIVREWDIGFGGSKIGVAHNGLSNPTDLSSGLTTELNFVTLSSLSKLSPLVYPAELITMGTPLNVRWQHGRLPSGSELKQLRINHVGQILIPDSLYR